MESIPEIANRISDIYELPSSPTEIYIPLPGAAVQIDRPWSFEEMAALDYSRTPHWVTKQLAAALAAEEPEEKPYCRYCPNGPNDLCASTCRVCGALCFGTVRA